MIGGVMNRDMDIKTLNLQLTDTGIRTVLNLQTGKHKKRQPRIKMCSLSILPETMHLWMVRLMRQQVCMAMADFCVPMSGHSKYRVREMIPKWL